MTNTRNKPRDVEVVGVIRPFGEPTPLQDAVAPHATLVPGWTAIVSMVFACGLVASFACPPAVAESEDDPEKLAIIAREELARASADRKETEKQARLNERLAIRKIAEDKERAEEVVTANVKAELDRISNEKVVTQQIAVEKVRVARELAIRANQMADDMSEEKRKVKVLQVDNLGPAKKALTKALAEKAFADDDAAYRREFAEKALSLQQRANTEAADRKDEVEKAVLELSQR